MRRRTPLALLALGAVLAIALGLPGRAGAEDGSVAPFPNGTASATAVVTRVTPGVGSLPTGIFGGVALSEVTNVTAQAQAETLDLGLIGLLLVALGIVPAEDLPQPLTVDNRAGDADASATERPVADSTLGVGHLQVDATTTPSARASSTIVSSYGGVVEVSAGRAESASAIEPGRAREARASVSVDVQLAGIVRLSGLRWHATHRTGADARQEAGFELREATIGGVPVPLEPLSALEEAVNAALEPSGVSIRLPEVERRTEPSDLVRVSSLRVQLKDTPAGKAALGPVLNLTREQRKQLYDELSRAYGPAAAALLAADVAGSIVSGTGFLSIEVGGAEATSGALPSPAFGAVGGTGSTGSGPPPTLGRLPLGSVVPGAPTPSTDPPAVTGATPVHAACRSAHEDRPLHCSDGRLVAAGSIGLAAVVGVAVADLRRRRRLVAAGTTVVAGGGTTWTRVVRPYAPLGAACVALVLAAAVAVPRVRVPFAGDRQVPRFAQPVVDASGAPVPGPLQSGGAPLGGTPAEQQGVRPCADRALQVPADPYSPPCYAFRGANGGATTRGVTADEIVVSVREVEAGSASDIFAGLSSQAIEPTSENRAATWQALADYFSDRFQLYGRRIRIDYHRGVGNGIVELLGGGKEQALADAIVAAEEVGAFADLSGITLPYADALARHGVLSFGAPYPSRAWFEARRPFVWSVFPDGTNVVSATTSAIVGRYPPGSIAEHAGGSQRGKPRRFAVVAPENAEYQESINVLIDQLRDADIDVALNQRYKLDLASFPNQASDIVAQVKDAGVTSVICMCDPAMLAFGLTPKANEQDYEPEWITAGLVFVDQDVVAQAIDTRQWSHAFGTAYNAVSEPIGGSFPYFAYKSVRPDDEPVAGVEELYYQMYLLVIGLQMAGPDLTPATFQQGMFAYPGAFGPRGTWDFGPGDYTPTNDYREIWWDPDRVSGQNRLRGAWAQLGGGRRWSPEDPPRGRAPFFEEG